MKSTQNTLSNKQTWNRYAYALNNPVSLRDPSGLVTPICGVDDDDERIGNVEMLRLQQVPSGLRS